MGALRRRSLPTRLSALMLTAACLTACAVTPRGDAHLLDFLAHDAVTRGEVIAHLGPDYTASGDSRTLTYRVGQNATGYYLTPHTSDSKSETYDLILTFDAQDTVRQYRLLSTHRGAPPQ